MPTYKVVKEFNKYKPKETIDLPNELVSANQIDPLLASGHITGPPYAIPAPENVNFGSNPPRVQPVPPAKPAVSETVKPAVKVPAKKKKAGKRG